VESSQSVFVLFNVTGRNEKYVFFSELVKLCGGIDDWIIRESEIL
jgi:hypothetical protein